MKKLILFLFIPFLSLGQGEQLYADGTENDQDGNSFEWINYGTQVWAIENANVVTYRDGTPIPQVTYFEDWSDPIGAWSFVDNNDESKGRFYNWYAIAGIHDEDPNTPNKEFAPEGWGIPSTADVYIFQTWLVQNGYNYDNSSNENEAAKSVASNSLWLNENPNSSSTNQVVEGEVGYNQSTNNLAGFNAIPYGENGFDISDTFGEYAAFWTSTPYNEDIAYDYYVHYNSSFALNIVNPHKWRGLSVRFISESTMSLNNIEFDSIFLYPNPTTNYVYLNSDIELEVTVFDLLGKQVIREFIKEKLDISCLEKGTYIINLSDGFNTTSHKIIKN